MRRLTVAVFTFAWGLSAQDIQFWKTYVQHDNEFGLNSAIQLYWATGNPINPFFEALTEGLANPEVILRSFSGTAGVSPAVPLLNIFSAAGTLASPSVTQAGDGLFEIQMSGYNGTLFVHSAAIITRADSLWNGANSATRMEFYVTPTNGNQSEFMRLDPEGNLVLNESTSMVNANFGGFGGKGLQVRNTSGTSSLSIWGNRNYIIGADNLGNLDIWDDNAGAYRLIMDSSGSFTIGFGGFSDLDPGSNGEIHAKRLSVISSNSNASYFQMSTGFSALLQSYHTGSGTDLPIVLNIGTGTGAGIPRLTIQTGGVGLYGLSSTDASLSAGDLIAIGFSSADATANASIAQFKVISGSYLAITSSHTGSGTDLPMTFWTVGTRRMTIDNSGNLLINTTSGTDKVVVNGAVNASSGFKVNATTGQSVTTTVGNGAGGTCTLIFTGGIKTGGSC